MASASDLNDVLRKYVESSLKVCEGKKAKAEVEKVVKDVISRVESKDPRFKMGLEYRGSMYEKLKIKDADEFDFDLTITQLALEEAPKKRLPDIPSEYTTYSLRPGLQDAWRNLADPDGKLLSAERVVQAFSSLVRQAIVDINDAGSYAKFKFDFKTNHPAVTIIFKEGGQAKYDVDLAPVIEVKKWPENLTIGWEKRKRKGWPSEELVQKIKTSSVYLVPKLYKDQHHEMRNYLWRYAFNKAEKKLLLDSDTGVANNARRPVLRILKGLLSSLQWKGLRSYHIKTVLLHEYETWAESDNWKQEELGERVKSATRRLKACLETPDKPKLKHYFLPDINILEGINDEQKKQTLESIKAFLKDPYAAVTKLTEGAVASGAKQKPASCKPYIKLLQDFMREVKKKAQEENSEAIINLCKQFEDQRFAQLGVKSSSL